MIAGVESRILRVSEIDAARDLAAILDKVQEGVEVVIERADQPFAILLAARPRARTISECIAMAEAHEKERGSNVPRLDPDFASDVQDIVSNRKPSNPPAWD